MNWLWLNIPLMAVFFVAMTGIPMWLVFRHPDTGPAGAHQTARRAAAPRAAATRAAASRAAASRAAASRAAATRAARAAAGDARTSELAGASR